MDVLGIRRWWLIVALALLGGLVGLVVSLVSTPARKAEALVLISSPSGTSAVNPFLPNLRELATSGVLAGNVRSTLRLNESVAELSDHLDAEVRPQSQVIAISVEDEQADRARQIAQEAAVVFTQLVQSRFGARSPPLQAALIDSARLRSASSRQFARNVAVGAVIGLLLGILGTLLRQGVPTTEETAGASDRAIRDLRKRESQLDQRVKMVSARERELAKRAGQLASRGQELEQRESELTARIDQVSAEDEQLVPAAQTAKAETAGADAGPLPSLSEPVAGAEPVVAPRRGWNINDLEHAVSAQGDASPEQAEEWRTYLYFLREHATADGALPGSFEPLISEVFGEITGAPPAP